MNFLFGFFIISLPILFIVVLLAVINFPSFSKPKEERNNTHSNYIENLLFELQSVDDRRGFKQLNMIRYKKNKIKRILKKNFNVNEVTYIKYMDSINEVYHVFLRNLEKYYRIKKSIKTLDKYFWDGGLKNNEKKQRDRLIKKMNVEVNYLLFQNEKALFKLDVLEIESSSVNGFSFRKVNRVKESLIKLSEKIHFENGFSNVLLRRQK